MTAHRMTPAEAVMLCRFAKACCPQQAFDEYTPDAWHELLGDLRFEDCKQGVIDVAKRQPFVSPSEIRVATRRYRYQRIEAFGPFDPPPEIANAPNDDFLDTAYRAWLKDMQTRIADGDLTREQWDTEQAAIGATGNREVPELSRVFRRLPAADDKR